MGGRPGAMWQLIALLGTCLLLCLVETLTRAPLRAVKSNDSANTGQVLRECQTR